MFFLASILGIVAVGAAFVGLESTYEEVSDPAEDVPAPVTPSEDGGDSGTGGIILSGGDEADTLTGTGADDQMNGYADNDSLTGGGGDDQLFGSEGRDTLSGGTGHDTLNGGAGNDQLDGAEGDDWLAGDLGDDTLRGGAGNDSLVGGQGDDQLEGGTGDDWLAGRHGDDSLIGGLGADTLSGFSGNDVLDGRVLGASGQDIDSGDSLSGGAGDDTLIAGVGDLLYGQEGADTGFFDASFDGPIATWADFDSTEDQIVILYDASETPDPQVSLSSDPEVAGATQVLLDGVPVARISGESPPILEDIALISRDAA